MALFFLLIILYRGFMFFATLLNIGNYWGSMYSYYNLTKGEYLTYTLLTILTSIVAIIVLFRFFIERHHKKPNTSIFIIVFLMGLLVWLGELYLNAIFVGKG